MDDEVAHETLESLLARIEGLERCLGLMGKIIIDNLPKVEGDLIDGFDQFARKARQENLHEVQIDLMERMAEWFRRLAAARKGEDPRTGPRTPRQRT